MNDLSRQSFDTPARRCSSRGAFTLIELLVVVSIIALLISILLPALHRARDEARRIVDATQLKQLITASVTYSVENKNYAPYRGIIDWTSWHWPHETYLSGISTASKNYNLNKSLFEPYLGIGLEPDASGNPDRQGDEIVFCNGGISEYRYPDYKGWPNYGYRYITYQYYVQPLFTDTARNNYWLHERNGVKYQPDLTNFSDIKAGRWPIWGCMTLSTQPGGGTWLSHDGIDSEQQPTGMNAAYFDGSAGWSPFNECEPYLKLGNSQQWYWPIP